jgi:hypothetical protein
MPDWKRIGAGIWSGGLSELAGWDNTKNFLFGGKATKGMASGPQSADYQHGYLQQFNNRQAPAMDAGQADQTRGQQGQLANMLFQQARGQTPGAGELAVQRQAGNAMAQQTSAAQMARGANAALAARNAARTTADIGANAAGQASIAQMQDQQAATHQLGGLLGNMRGQDIGVAQGNQQAQMQQQQLQLQSLAQMLGVDVATLQQDLAKRGLAAQDKGMLPSLLQIGGQMGAAAASDRNLKTGIVDADEQVDEMLAKLSPKAYSYKDEKHGVGPRVGIMAQDLERSSLGRDIVDDTTEGKMIDVNKALSLALAAVARLDKRVRELEARR